MLCAFFERINYLVYHIYHNKIIYDELVILYDQFNVNYLNELIENYIDTNYDTIKPTSHNDDTYPYYRYNLYSSDYVDIFMLKMTKNSRCAFKNDKNVSKIMFIINDGKLHEHLFKKSFLFNRYYCKNSSRTYINDYTCVDPKMLHKIHAEEYTETLHIVIYK